MDWKTILMGQENQILAQPKKLTPKTGCWQDADWTKQANETNSQKKLIVAHSKHFFVIKNHKNKKRKIACTLLSVFVLYKLHVSE